MIYVNTIFNKSELHQAKVIKITRRPPESISHNLFQNKIMKMINLPHILNNNDVIASSGSNTESFIL